MDDSNYIYLKKTDAELFRQRSNSTDVNIQFTIACQTEKGQSIFFLDSRVTMLSDGSVEIDVHTNKYLDFASHKLVQRKEGVVTTLLNRANYLPSCPELRTNKRERVLADLRANGYTDSVLKKCLNNKAKRRQSQEKATGVCGPTLRKGCI